MKAKASHTIGLAAFGASIVLSALGQLCMKVGMLELHRVADAGQSSLTTLQPAATWTVIGLASYGLSLVAWLLVLVRYPLSYAYPLLGLSYVLVYIGATQLPRLMEPATPLRTLGTLLVLAGVALVSMTGDNRTKAPRV